MLRCGRSPSDLRELQCPKYSIYLKDDHLFGCFEDHGKDMKADWVRMAADKKTQDWRVIMEPMRDALPTRKEAEWWAEMEEVFHMD